jgi:phage FluMu protein Com
MLKIKDTHNKDGDKKLSEIRCSHCNRLLLKAHFVGQIEIMCSRCKRINKFMIDLH